MDGPHWYRRLPSVILQGTLESLIASPTPLIQFPVWSNPARFYHPPPPPPPPHTQPLPAYQNPPPPLIAPPLAISDQRVR